MYQILSQLASVLLVRTAWDLSIFSAWLIILGRAIFTAFLPFTLWLRCVQKLIKVSSISSKDFYECIPPTPQSTWPPQVCPNLLIDSTCSREPEGPLSKERGLFFALQRTTRSHNPNSRIIMPNFNTSPDSYNLHCSCIVICKLWNPMCLNVPMRTQMQV